MECERCRDAQVRLAQVRRSLSTALDAIQRCAEAPPSSCPHCGHCLHCAGTADVPCGHRDGASGPARPEAEDGAELPRPAAWALTPREHEVLVLLAGGMSNRHIARQLGIAEKTVKNHLGAIFGKLGVHARTQAALYAIKAGMHP